MNPNFLDPILLIYYHNEVGIIGGAGNVRETVRTKAFAKRFKIGGEAGYKLFRINTSMCSCKS